MESLHFCIYQIETTTHYFSSSYILLTGEKRVGMSSFTYLVGILFVHIVNKIYFDKNLRSEGEEII